MMTPLCWKVVAVTVILLDPCLVDLQVVRTRNDLMCNSILEMETEVVMLMRNSSKELNGMLDAKGCYL